MAVVAVVVVMEEGGLWLVVVMEGLWLKVYNRGRRGCKLVEKTRIV